MRQQQKLEKNTEVLDASKFLLRKVPKGNKNEKKQISAKEQNNNKVVKTSE